MAGPPITWSRYEPSLRHFLQTAAALPPVDRLGLQPSHEHLTHRSNGSFVRPGALGFRRDMGGLRDDSTCSDKLPDRQHEGVDEGATTD